MTTIFVKRTAVTLEGNKISGNTFPIKDYIKTYLGGKWESFSKSWIIDTEKLENLMKLGVIYVDNSVAVSDTRSDVSRGIWQRNGELTEDF